MSKQHHHTTAMGAGASTQLLQPHSLSWNDAVNNNTTTNNNTNRINNSSTKEDNSWQSTAGASGTQASLPGGFSDFSLYPDRFLVSERRQTISHFSTEDSPSPSSSSSWSSSSSSSSSSAWSRRRATTICGDAGVEEQLSSGGGGGPGSTAKEATAGWRTMSEEGRRRRRHHSTGAKQSAAFTRGPFSDFTLYPDRYHFTTEEHR